MENYLCKTISKKKTTTKLLLLVYDALLSSTMMDLITTCEICVCVFFCMNDGPNFKKITISVQIKFLILYLNYFSNCLC